MTDFIRRYSDLLDEGYSEYMATRLANEDSWDYYNGEPVDEWN